MSNQNMEFCPSLGH